jgi:hypothetical protein
MDVSRIVHLLVSAIMPMYTTRLATGRPGKLCNSENKPNLCPYDSVVVTVPRTLSMIEFDLSRRGILAGCNRFGMFSV